MCYDLQVSGVSFATITISGLFALTHRQPILGCLMLCYGIMQLSEVLIWRGIDTNNQRLNEIGTKLAKYSLPSHNIAIGIGVLIAYWAYKGQFKYWVPLLIGILFYIGVLISYSRNKKFESKITPHCKLPEDKDRCTEISARLQWPFPHSWYAVSFAVSLAILAIYIKPMFPNGVVIGSFYSILWIITCYLGKLNVQGSFWCWSAAMFSPLLVALTTYLSRNVVDLKS
jgi:hypothetical protein